MDPSMARKMADELRGKTIGRWVIGDLLGSGKSAVVLAGQEPGSAETVAVKVYDPDMVQKYKPEMQLERIRRQCELMSVEHPNVVRTLGGGRCADTNLLYTVMNYLPWRDLAAVITQVPRGRVIPIIHQVATAARFLLTERGVVHRDIKPDNILVNDAFDHAVLMDLGVIRTYHTDNEWTRPKDFVGTLQYAAPEFLLGEMTNDERGWLGLTFYQIGAVMHDLIMRQRIFQAASEGTFARLAKAVDRVVPRVEADDMPAELLALARACLEKDPQTRLEKVTWESFDRLLHLKST